MADVILYHNPRCSKSREALALLQARGIEPTIRKYLDTPLDAAELDQLLQALQLPPSAVVRTGEAAYKALTDRSENGLRAALLQTPILLERPIVVSGGQARIGRPPERILELFA